MLSQCSTYYNLLKSQPLSNRIRLISSMDHWLISNLRHSSSSSSSSIITIRPNIDSLRKPISGYKWKILWRWFFWLFLKGIAKHKLKKKIHVIFSNNLEKSPFITVFLIFQAPSVAQSDSTSNSLRPVFEPRLNIFWMIT